MTCEERRMIDEIRARLRQRHRTIGYPDAPAPAMPERFRGLPVIDASRCGQGCRECADACPTDAIHLAGGGGLASIDLGRCLFCTECQDACPDGALSFGQDYRLAVRRREELEFKGEALRLATALEGEALRLFGRSLKLRQVSAGGCNGCESDVAVLSTIVFDLSRFGIQFVASPRHADGILVTGPVTANTREALRQTYDAVPPPKIVIAVGACAINGGPYVDHPEVSNGASAVVPIDLLVPGCPPHPMTILDGLLRLLGRI
jgi:Ni,Fe-hydrogenase III small subunit/formate hydrogenlyase subunit 6/NADH:ubiquinone oxidoreductase subunit I